MEKRLGYWFILRSFEQIVLALGKIVDKTFHF